MKMRRLLPILLLLAPISCIGPGPAEQTTLGDLAPTAEELQARPDRVMSTAQYWPELPLEAVAKIRTDMTREEVVAILGEPIRENGAVLDINEAYAWDGLIQIYRYNDARLSDFPMTRDLVVAYGPAADGRDADWVVVRARLF